MTRASDGFAYANASRARASRADADLGERAEDAKGGEWRHASASDASAKRTIARARALLAHAEILMNEQKHVEAIEAYTRAIAANVEAWMNVKEEDSGEARAARAEARRDDAGSAIRMRCSIEAYRSCASVALSGRAMSKFALGSWSEAIRDGEAAIDSAPEEALAHERLSDILFATEAAGDLARAYADNARAIRALRGDNTGKTKGDGKAANKSAIGATSLTLAKTIAEGDVVEARRMALYGGGVMYADHGDDNKRMYEDRFLFLEKAKTMFVRKYAEVGGEQHADAEAPTSWLDNAFVLAGFDNMGAYERANVCLSIGNIFSWVGDFSGAAELYSCGITVVASTQDDSEALDDIEPILEVNRVLCQLRSGHFEKAWKNVRKLMREEKRHKFASGFLRIAEIACVREEWDMAEQSFRIASRFGAELQVRHKIVLAQRSALENRPSLVDVEQLEELDKIQDGKEAEFAETPRFPTTASGRPPSFKKQNSLTDVDDDPVLYAEATQELLDELANGFGSPDSQSSADANTSKLFSGAGSRSLKLTDVMADLAGSTSPRRSHRKRKARDEACSCKEMFSYLGWGSIDVDNLRAPNSVEDEVFLAALLDTDADGAVATDGTEAMDSDAAPR